MRHEGFVLPGVEALQRGFEGAQDPERAVAMARYMRDQFAFYGIPAPLQRSIARTALRGLPTPTEVELAEFARACWQRPQREWQYVACDTVGAHVRTCSPAFLTMVEEMITTRSWWDTVDTLAGHAVGPLVAMHTGLAAEMDRWVLSDNFWLARAALLHQLGYRERTDSARLFRYCEARAADREFFIRKAVGWALRQYARTDPDRVRAFVEEHDAELSGLSKREALRHLA